MADDERLREQNRRRIATAPRRRRTPRPRDGFGLAHGPRLRLTGLDGVYRWLC